MSLYTREQLVASNGVYRTQALFQEFVKKPEDKEIALFNFREYDTSYTKSLYKLYMKYDTEYEAAIGIFGSWKHWNKLKKLSWFKDNLDIWNEEMKVRQAALGKKTLIDAAEEGKVEAAKILYQEVVPKRGRPSKQEKAKALEKDKEIDSLLSNIVDIHGKT